MRTLLFSFLLSLFGTFSAQAQYQGLEKVIEEIELGEDTLRGIYNWVVAHIKYDPKEANKRTSNARKKPRSTKKDLLEIEQEQLNSVLKKRKGVCEHYAILLHAIASKLGMPSYIIEGYIKNGNGRINYDIGHAWNAVYYEGDWHLIDATWGAGYVNERGKFVRSDSDRWYDVDPGKMIANHMPFDPMWQLMDSKINYDDFENGLLPEVSSSLSDSEKQSIRQYLALDLVEQMPQAVKRSEEMGKGIALVKRWRRINSKNAHSLDKSGQLDAFNEAASEMEELGQEFQTYYKKGKEKKFAGKLWSLDYSIKKLSEMKIKVIENLDVFEAMTVRDSKFNRSNRQNISQTKKFLVMIEEELAHLMSEE